MKNDKKGGQKRYLFYKDGLVYTFMVLIDNEIEMGDAPDILNTTLKYEKKIKIKLVGNG